MCQVMALWLAWLILEKQDNKQNKAVYASRAETISQYIESSIIQTFSGSSLMMMICSVLDCRLHKTRYLKAPWTYDEHF